MNAALVAAGLMLGLASSPHCALMCSAPCTAVAGACSPARPVRALAAWHAGRLVAYAAAGAIAAASVGLIAAAAESSALVKPFWTLMQVAVLMFGLTLLWRGRMPRLFDALARQVTPTSRPEQTIRFFPRSGARKAALIGAAWVGLPCGVLYAAIGVAALADDAVTGAAVMAAFSLGSAAGLVGLPLLWHRYAGGLEGTAALRLAGLLLACGAAWALWHGLGDAAAQWCRSL